MSIPRGYCPAQTKRVEACVPAYQGVLLWRALLVALFRGQYLALVEAFLIPIDSNVYCLLTSRRFGYVSVVNITIDLALLQVRNRRVLVSQCTHVYCARARKQPLCFNRAAGCIL